MPAVELYLMRAKVHCRPAKRSSGADDICAIANEASAGAIAVIVPTRSARRARRRMADSVSGRRRRSP